MLIVGMMCDKVVQMIQVEGILLYIIDMVGLCEMEDEVEWIGIVCMWSEIECVDVVLYLFDLCMGMMVDDEMIVVWFLVGVLVVCVLNKMDLIGVLVCVEYLVVEGDLIEVYLLVKCGDGIDMLCVELLWIVGWQVGVEGVYFVCEWYLIVLWVVQEYFVQVVDYVEQCVQLFDLFVEELWFVQEQFNVIIGEFMLDDLLGVIFSRFCIGK